VHAEPEQDPERIRSLLTKQIHSPVQWVRSMQYARQQGVSSGVEIGPGKVLSGLCKRIERDFEGLSTEEPADLAKSLDAVKG
jgi:[acyl-carrier-protein] S-malonyltransferase